MFIILLLVTLTGIIQIPAVQNYTAKNVTNLISRKLGTSIIFSNLKIAGLNRVWFNDLLVYDPHNDTLIYGKKVLVVTSSLYKVLTKQETDNIIIRKLQFENSKFNLNIDSSGYVNLQFFMDFLQKGKDTVNKVKKPFKIKDIRIIDSRFTMHNQKVTRVSKGIDFGNMVLNDFNLHALNLSIYKDTLKAYIGSMKLTEKSGFEIDKFSAYLNLSTKHLGFEKASIVTPTSLINADHIYTHFAKYKDFATATLYQKVLFDVSIADATLNLADLGFFHDVFWEDNQRVLLTGKFYGQLSNLKGNNISLHWGNSSRIKGNIDLNGLPDVNETFLIFDLAELSTNIEDITSLKLPRGYHIDLPKNLKNIQNISYAGNFTGYFNDFVAHGKLRTNLGDVSTDISFAPDSLNQLKFEGRLKTLDFELGKMIANEKLFGKISLDAQINGIFLKDKSFQADINGVVPKFQFNKYVYQNININGSVTNRRFVGKMDIQDPNLNMEFNGLVDLSLNPWQYDFRANIIDANLYALNITDIDTNYHISVFLKAKATGKSIDEVNGEVELLNSLFTKSDRQIQVYDLKLMVKNDPELNEIILRSDIADVDVSGKFKISNLKNDLINYLSTYVPNLFANNIIFYKDTLFSQINLNAKFKQTEPFFNFFFPKYLVGENSVIKAVFNPSKLNLFKLDFNTPVLRIGNNTWQGLVVNVASKDSMLYADIGGQSLNIAERIEFKNFTVKTSTRKNLLNFSTNWMNWDTTLYKGKLTGNVRFCKTDTFHSLLFNINPSTIVFNDSLWDISACTINAGSQNISVDNFNLLHNNERLSVKGRLSNSSNDSLLCSFNNFNLANLNYFTRNKNLLFNGHLNGTSQITGFMDNRLFFSSLSIDSLFINNEPYGHVSINSDWNHEKEALSINAIAERGKLVNINFSGDYYPSQNKKIDFHFTINKMKTDVFSPFVAKVFSDLKGLVSGQLEITGMGGHTSLSGKLKFQKNSLTVNYLRTRYNFTTDIDVSNNNFVLDNVEFFDADGNNGFVNGIVHVEHLKDLSFNLSVTANNLFCLNTREIDNKMFYGTAYATGTFKMNGIPSNLNFDVIAKSNKNTRICIPLTQTADVSRYSFIKLIQNEPAQEAILEEKRNFKVDFSGMQMNLNFDVTPDAEVQIIFDSKVGDIIKGRGNGKMNMSINTLGTFNLVGDYNIEKGDYLFTSHNLINKKFNIEPGGSLRWSGDPFNAQIDLTATYSTRASLYQLLGDSTSAGKTLVNCQIFLTGLLMTPTWKFGLELPNVDESIRERVNSKITSDEERTRQIMALLVLNQFYPISGSSNQFNTQSESNNIAGVNASELLANQVNYWISQISNDFNFDINYHPGTKSALNSREVEAALSTQLLNDRLSVNGSVDYKINAAAQNSYKLIGDVDLDYKLNKKGTLRFRAFNRSNDQLTTEYSTHAYTQGAGIFFVEEFNTLKELLGRYWSALTGKNKKKKSAEINAKGI